MSGRGLRDRNRKTLITGIASPTSLVKGTAEKFKADNCEHQNSKENKQPDLQQWSHRLQDRLEDHL